jgi:soluble lytic murein transglycosylase-like protein
VGALKYLGIAALLLSANPARAQSVDRWSRYIEEASVRFSLPQEWIRRVMRAESGGRTRLGGRPIESRVGAMGLMQLMPGTWRDMRAALGLGADPHDARDNILAGTAYLRLMYDRFGYPGLFAAYNAGPARFERHLVSGRSLPAETVAYVASVAGAVPAAGEPPRTATAQPPVSPSLFALRAVQAPQPVPPYSRPMPEASASLFVRLSVSPR